MKNPINKRIFRIIKNNPGKYISVFLSLLVTVTFISSFFITQISIEKIYFEQLDKGKIEDGQFEVTKRLGKKHIEIIENEKLKLFESFYKDINFDTDKTLRIFKNRESINIPIVSYGRIPEKNDEIAVSYNFANSNKYLLGQKINILNKEYYISGLVSSPDYSSLLKNRSDLVMDTGYFGIAFLNEKEFEKINSAEKYLYSYHDIENLKSDDANKKLDRIIRNISKENTVIDSVVRYDNKKITYLIDDMGGDVPAILITFGIVILAISFLSLIQAKSLIEEESSVIGTLISLGYRKSELMIHYLLIPFFITIFAIILGNIISYTIGYNIYKNLYYLSFDIPKFKLFFSTKAFIMTSIIPLFIIISTNFILLNRKLKLTPIKFLRKDLKKSKKIEKFNLKRFSFLNLFKIRILLDNKLNIFSLFFGLLIANLLLIFGLSFKPIFKNYANDIKREFKYNIITIIKKPIKINENAIKGTILDLKYKNEKNIQFLGIEKNSKYDKYIKIADLKSDEVIISNCFSNKYGIVENDSIDFYVPHFNEKYSLKVKGIFKDINSLKVYMTRSGLNNIFKFPSEYFNAYLSDKKLNIDENLIITQIDKQKISLFINHFLESFGGMTRTVLIISILFYIIILYTVSKLIIDKSKLDISYLKIFGFNSSEISIIYINSIRNAVVLYLFLIVPFLDVLTKEIIKISLIKIDAYINPKIDKYIYFISILVAIIIYVFIQKIQTKKIEKMHMVKELKNING